MTTFSLHQIYQPDYLSFEPSEYSRFKFGDNTLSQNFGRALADGFIENHLQSKQFIEQLVVFSSPYSFIPTATFALKNQFVFTLNAWLAENKHPVVQEGKVHRTSTYKEDYGSLNAEQRIKLICSDSFYIDKVFLKNKVLLFIDDIRITGSHERMILRMMKEFDLTNETYLLYFAELVNQAIEPQFENFLNYYSVKSIFDLNSIIEGDFTINTRIVKYILGYDWEAFNIFIEDKKEDFIVLLYNMALGNNYHLIPAYSKNLNYIKQVIHNNSFTPIKL